MNIYVVGRGDPPLRNESILFSICSATWCIVSIASEINMLQRQTDDRACCVCGLVVESELVDVVWRIDGLMVLKRVNISLETRQLARCLLAVGNNPRGYCPESRKNGTPGASRACSTHGHVIALFVLHLPSRAINSRIGKTAVMFRSEQFRLCCAKISHMPHEKIWERNQASERFGVLS